VVDRRRSSALTHFCVRSFFCGEKSNLLRLRGAGKCHEALFFTSDTHRSTKHRKFSFLRNWNVSRADKFV